MVHPLLAALIALIGLAWLLLCGAGLVVGAQMLADADGLDQTLPVAAMVTMCLAGIVAAVLAAVVVL